MKKLLILTIAVILIVNFAFAGDFEEDLKRLASTNAENYLQPFVTGFGTDMNSGLFYSAKPHKLFGFDVGVRVMGAMIPDDDLTYDFLLPETVPIINPINLTDTLDIPTASLYPGADLEAPTVFGGEGHEIAPDIADLEQLLADSFGIPVGTIPTNTLEAIAAQATFPIPPGIDFNVMPLAMPQFSIGLPMKSEVLLRWMPTYSVPDVGDINFFGIGVKHSVSQYIPMCPVQVSAQFAYQALEVGDIITSKHTCFNIHASKTFAMFTPYVGVGIENSSLSVDYTIEGTGNPLIDGTPVEFDIDGENSFRMRAGFTLKLLILGINADYALGNYNAYTLGVFFSLR